MCWPETYMHVQDVVRSNIGPKLTKSHPGTTHEGWMDKWVDGQMGGPTLLLCSSFLVNHSG
jgi:hypothetical protein